MSNEQSKKSIAFIGSVGVPNCYGGFEAFLESVTPSIVASGHKVLVTCDKNRYTDLNPDFNGINRVFVSTPANGAYSPFHDLIAFFKVIRKVDAVVVLGVSAGPFFILMRILSSIFNKTLVVNVDGVEWRRSKFSKPVRFVLKAFDACAQFSATKIIYDNKELLPFLFKPFRKKAFEIPYSGDHVVRKENIIADGSALTICRIEPENNIEILIDGVLKSNLKKYRLIGNWDNSEFGKSIKQKYNNHPTIEIIDPVYDIEILSVYRERCDVYLHGHSVGGTNPSLVEMLFYDCQIICFDCDFNRATAGNAATYFSTAENLSLQLNQLNDAQIIKDSSARNEIRSKYTAQIIAHQYLDIL